MLEKEAFARLRNKVWQMLDGNEPINPQTTAAIDHLEPKPFRESIARAVLNHIGQDIGRPMTPLGTETEENFIDAIAFTFAFLAADDRPEEYNGYTAHEFAVILITYFCRGYATLNVASPTDKTIGYCKLDLTIPTCPSNTEAQKIYEHTPESYTYTFSSSPETLKRTIAHMDTAKFAPYSILTKV